MRNHLLLPAAILLLAWPGLAAIRLASPFGNHMVLQQGVPVPVWGSGCPGGDTVVVSVAGQSVAAQSDWAGRWMVRLPPMQAGGPYQMIVSIGGRAPYVPSPVAMGGGGAEINDVVIGEVWLAAGHSSMAKTVAASANAKEVIAGARYPWVRTLKTSATGQWVYTSPDTVSGYSATAYAFAREMYDRLKVPIGIIESSRESGAPEEWLTGRSLYNSMIAPFVPSAVRGVIWDQGDSSGAAAKPGVLEGMIKDWRQAWSQPELPFFFAQSPNPGAADELEVGRRLALHVLDLFYKLPVRAPAR